MDEQRRGYSRPVPRRPVLALAAFLAISVVVSGTLTAAAEDVSILLAAAAEQGTFNVGAAHAVATRVASPDAGIDYLKLDYMIPPGTAAGFYAKAFPAVLRADQIDVVRLAVKAEEPDQARQITAAIEIKGTAGLQRIPLEIRSDWIPVEQTIDWPVIGTVREVVLLVNSISDRAPASGTILIDARFNRLPVLRKLSLSPGVRFAGVLLASLMVAMLTALLRSAGGWRSGGDTTLKTETLAERASPARSAGLHQLVEDLVRSAGVVLIVLLVIETYILGSRGPLETGWTPLGLAVAGAAVAAWWKIGLTGKHLTSLEAFQDVLASGLLATSASSLAILQAPTSWSELFLLSQTVAAATLLVYHAANAYRLASSGKHLGAAATALIVGTPYVVGGLVLLESGGLMQSLGTAFTLGLLEAQPAVLEFIGRVFVLFCFNEAVAQGLGLATKGSLLKSPRAHASMLAVVIAAVAAFPIAALGSGATVAAWPIAQRLVAAVLTTILSQAGLWAEAYLVTGMLMDAIHGQAPSGDSAFSHPVTGMKKGMVYSGVFMGSLYTLGLLWELAFIRWMAGGYPIIAATLLGASVFPLIKTIIETFDGSPPFFRRLQRNYVDPVLSLRGIVIGLGLGYGLAHGLPEKELATRAWFGFGFGAIAYSGIDVLRDCLYAARGHGRLQSLRYYIAQARTWWLDRSGHRILPRRHPGFRRGRQVPPLPRRGTSAGTLRDLPPRQQVGASQPGDGHGGGELAAHGGAGGSDQLVHRLLALRDQPHLHEGLFLERRDTDPDSFHQGRSGPDRGEPDPGPPLGPVDVPHHQFLPAAHGRTNLVQPGRRDPHRDRDLPGPDDVPRGVSRLEPPRFYQPARL